MSNRLGICALGLIFVAGCTGSMVRSDPSAPPEYLAWRKQREEALRSETGYLALAGLYWLHEGYQSFGSAADNDIVFPAGRAPARAGVFRVKAGQVTVEMAPGIELLVDEKPVSRVSLISDAGEQSPTQCRLGELTFWLIDRSGRLGIRLRDPQCAILRAYRRTPSFPYDPRWCLQARFEPFDEPRTITVPTILGMSTTEQTTGRLAFVVDGSTHYLEPTGQSEEDFFIVFGDGTNGRESYGGGRFLGVPIPAPGQATVIDFNRAYNPPCAYNPYTTCPMPPPQNRLPFRVEAGERIEKPSHDHHN